MEFRDALAIQYRKPAFNLPSTYDGCGEPFNIDHALCCRRGGLIIRRHNEVRDVLGDMMETAWGCCIREPIILGCPESSERFCGILFLDIK
jgi:hypothetical protein